MNSKPAYRQSYPVYNTFNRHILPFLAGFQLPSCWILLELVEVFISVMFQVALGRQLWREVCCFCLAYSPGVPEIGAYIQEAQQRVTALSH